MADGDGLARIDIESIVRRAVSLALREIVDDTRSGLVIKSPPGRRRWTDLERRIAREALAEYELRRGR